MPLTINYIFTKLQIISVIVSLSLYSIFKDNLISLYGTHYAYHQMLTIKPCIECLAAKINT